MIKIVRLSVSRFENYTIRKYTCIGERRVILRLSITETVSVTTTASSVDELREKPFKFELAIVPNSVSHFLSSN